MSSLRRSASIASSIWPARKPISAIESGEVAGRSNNASRRFRFEATLPGGSAMEVLEQHHDLEEVRAVLGHARVDTTQIYASIRPPQLKRTVAFYEAHAERMLGR